MKCLHSLDWGLSGQTRLAHRWATARKCFCSILSAWLCFVVPRSRDWFAPSLLVAWQPSLGQCTRFGVGGAGGHKCTGVCFAILDSGQDACAFVGPALIAWTCNHNKKLDILKLAPYPHSHAHTHLKCPPTQLKHASYAHALRGPATQHTRSVFDLAVKRTLRHGIAGPPPMAKATICHWPALPTRGLRPRRCRLSPLESAQDTPRAAVLSASPQCCCRGEGRVSAKAARAQLYSCTSLNLAFNLHLALDDKSASAQSQAGVGA